MPFNHNLLFFKQLILFFLKYLEKPDPTKPFPPIKKIIYPIKLGSIALSGDITLCPLNMNGFTSPEPEK